MVTRREVYIGIHPYTPSPLWQLDGEEPYTYEDQPEYVRLRDARLSRHAENQVLLIPELFWQEYCDKFKLHYPGWKERIFFTEVDNPTPIDMTLDELSESIKRNFPANKYKIWGAEVYLLEGIAVWGCAAYAYGRLNLPNKVLELEACWKRQIEYNLLIKLIRAQKFWILNNW